MKEISVSEFLKFIEENNLKMARKLTKITDEKEEHFITNSKG